jgi:hypothetical protein
MEFLLASPNRGIMEGSIDWYRGINLSSSNCTRPEDFFEIQEQADLKQRLNAVHTFSVDDQYAVICVIDALIEKGELRHRLRMIKEI